MSRQISEIARRLMVALALRAGPAADERVQLERGVLQQRATPKITRAPAPNDDRSEIITEFG